MKFSCGPDSEGAFRIELEGLDITGHVSGFQVQAGAGQDTTIVLRMTGVEFVADEVQGLVASLAGANVLAALDSLSPRQIEDHVVNSLDQGQSLVGETIKYIQRVARDAAGPN